MTGPDVRVPGPGLLGRVCPPHTLTAVICSPGDSRGLKRKRECSRLSGLKTDAGNPRQGKTLKETVPRPKVGDGTPKLTSPNCKAERDTEE